VATFDPSGRWIAGGSDEGAVIVWELATSKQRWHIESFPHELANDAPEEDNENRSLLASRHHRVTGLAISPDEQLIAAASDDQSVRVFDAADGKELHVLKADGPLHSVTFLERGSLINCCTEDGRIYGWDRKSGDKEVVPLRGIRPP
jgi:WD40 repeat protein